MKCLTEEEVVALSEGRVPPVAAEEIRAHLDACDACRALAVHAARALFPLSEAATEAGGPPAAALVPGTAVGRYLVLHVVGAGGMGVVYAAYDPELDRRVALKLVSADGEYSGDLETRLLREARAMAQLSHPNVVTVHDAGVVGGRVFIAMEFVEGGTLAGWLAAKARSFDEILSAFTHAGRGLAAAHARGIVHRDFKPTNVLVGNDGTVRVTDFGLARTARMSQPPDRSIPHEVGTGQSAELTVTGAVLGTPAFMAPEQAVGRPVDARTDIFSFCVSLYTALYRERPFAGETLEALQREIVEDRVRPPAPRAHVPSWIRPVLLRGLRASPDDRYPTMEALLRGLSRDPRRLRRRWMAAAGVLLLAAAGISTAYYWSAEQARRCAGAEGELAGVWDGPRKDAIRAAFLATGKPYAGDVWARTAGALDDYAAQWASMRREACEATHVHGVQSQEMLDLRMLCLEGRRREVRALTDLLLHPDEGILKNAVQAADALTRVEGCAAAATLQSLRPPPDDMAQERIGEIRAQLAKARSLQQLGRFGAAVALSAAAVRAAREEAYAPVLAEALGILGDAQQRAGSLRESVETLEQALVTAQAEGHDPALAQAMSTLVYVLGFRQAQFEEALRWGRLARAVLTRLPHEGLVEAQLETRVSSVLYLQGRAEEALLHAERSLSLAEKAIGRDQPQVADAHNNLGVLLESLGRYEDALEHYRRSLRMRERLLGGRHPAVAVSLVNMGSLLLLLGRPGEALALEERALVIAREALHDRHPIVATVHSSLGEVLTALRRPEEARGHIERALAIGEKTLGPKHPHVVGDLFMLGNALRLEGRYAAASAYTRRALEVAERAFGPSHPLTASALVGLGEILLARGLPARGGRQSLARLPTRAWGLNASGQVGDGTNTNRSTAVQVQGLTGVTVTAIAAFGNHSLALLSDGTVRAWGNNSGGQLGDGTIDSRSAPVQVKDPSDSTGFLSNVTAIAAGGNHSLALLSDSTVRAWGADDSGQIGDCIDSDTLTPVKVMFP